MLLAIIIATIILILSIPIINESFDYGILKIGAGCVVFVIGLIIGITIMMVIGYSIPTHYELTQTQEIVALNDQISTTGTFFISIGTINNELTYYFYVRDGDAIVSKQVPGDRTRIYEENRDDGIIKEFRPAFKNNKVYLFAAPPPNKYTIHIPKGTLVG